MKAHKKVRITVTLQDLLRMLPREVVDGGDLDAGVVLRDVYDDSVGITVDATHEFTIEWESEVELKPVASSAILQK